MAAPPEAAHPDGERLSTSGRAFRFWSPWLALFVLAWCAAYASLAPEPLRLFERSWTFILLGFCGAVVGNLTAVGGGIVFIPAIVLIYHLPPLTALKVALASQAFGMSSGAIGWAQKGVIPLRWLKVTVPGLLLGSLVSSLLIHPNALLVKVLFGPFSIFLGLLTLALMEREGSEANASDLPKGAGLPVLLVAFIGGMVTGWIAIGEGELVCAILMLAFGVNVSTSIGLGVLLLSINSIFLTLIHMAFLGGIPWRIAAFTLLGCVFGARFAPYLAGRFEAKSLKKIFAFIAICDGLLFILQYIWLR